ncbi:MAG: ABC transporter ATP-binding protein [Alphaproteobacteria bacterium]
MAEPILAGDGLEKRFGALAVSDGVSFEVRAGECHALIGPNGAGKTTLVHQLSGFVRPDRGRIRLAGADVTRLPAHARARRGLARTFQISSIIPGFTTLENVALAAQARAGTSFRFWGRAAGETALNDRARAALAEVGLEHRALVPAGALAHGEKRALELAIALALAPEVLVLDEPMAGVGVEEGARLVDLLQRLKARLAMLLIEHDMAAVFRLADRVSVLVDGRVIASGTPAEVRLDPAVRAAYLGEGTAP